jgi:hypothetical protein
MQLRLARHTITMSACVSATHALIRAGWVGTRDKREDARGGNGQEHCSVSLDVALTVRAPGGPGRGDVRLGLENWAC